MITGSYIPPLTMAKGIIFENTIFLFGGFDGRYNTCTDNIFKITNLDEPDSLECKLIPGEETLKLADFSETSINEKDIQTGNVPEARAGHALFSYGNSKLILVGGYNVKTYKNKSLARNCKTNLVCFDTSRNSWTNIKVLTGDSSLLQRCNFGSTAISDNRIILAGGVEYSEYGDTTKPNILSNH